MGKQEKFHQYHQLTYTEEGSKLMGKKYMGFGTPPKKTKPMTSRQISSTIRSSNKLMYEMMSPEQKKEYRRAKRELKNKGCMLYLIIATAATLLMAFTII